jgi:hypothetical protein
MPLRRPPALLLGLALLSAGALTQTLVAWTCSYLDQRDAIMGKAARYSSWIGDLPAPHITRIAVSREQRVGTAQLNGIWPFEEPPDYCGTFAHLTKPQRPAQPLAHLLTTIRPFDLPQLLALLEDDNRHVNRRSHTFAGWPWLSMHRIDSPVHSPHARRPQSEGVLRIDLGFRARSAPTQLLLPAAVAPLTVSNGSLIPINSWPVGVIWPNLLANTAVYSAAWLLLAAPIPAARHLRNRARRRRHHLCANCGYDWSATQGPCPECNASRHTNSHAVNPPPPTLPPQ